MHLGTIRQFFASAVLAAALLALGAIVPAQAEVAVAKPGNSAVAHGAVAGQYIVVFKDSVRDSRAMASRLASRHGFALQYTYQSALKGFSASMPDAAANALAGNPNVAYVEQDGHMQTAIFQPVGVFRINADTSPKWSLPVDVDIAIIDSGVADNPDLNIVAKVNCSGGSPRSGSCVEGSANDAEGHGSHVAGTAAANGSTNLIGVAPGARIWALKMFDDKGRGFTSWAIAAVDWVTANGAVIDVANMSISGGNSNALKSAIATSTAAGVTYVVAAGNDNIDAASTSPANSPDAITVSAMADYDGVGGGTGTPVEFCNTEADDSFASFSNHGSVVDITAPGVCVVSFWNTGTDLYYASGTSMASPHVAGAAALIHAELSDTLGQRPTAAQVRAELFARAVPQDDLDGGYDNANDDDGIAEPIVSLATGMTVAPAVTITSPGDGSTVLGTIAVAADVVDSEGVTQQVEFFVDGNIIGTDTDGGNGWSVSWDSTAVDDGTRVLSAVATDDNTRSGSASVSVTVDNVDDAPTVAITSPADGSTVNGVVAITADATDDGSVTQVEFFVDGGSVGVDNNGGDGWSVDWDTLISGDGPKVLTATATDDADQSTGSGGVSVMVGAAPTNLLHASISFSKKGPGLAAVVKVQLDPAGTPVAGAVVVVDFCSPSSGSCYFVGLEQATNSKGEVSFKVIGIADADVTVLSVVHASYAWDGVQTNATYP